METVWRVGLSVARTCRDCSRLCGVLSIGSGWIIVYWFIDNWACCDVVTIIRLLCLALDEDVGVAVLFCFCRWLDLLVIDCVAGCRHSRTLFDSCHGILENGEVAIWHWWEMMLSRWERCLDQRRKSHRDSRPQPMRFIDPLMNVSTIFLRLISYWLKIALLLLQELVIVGCVPPDNEQIAPNQWQQDGGRKLRMFIAGGSDAGAQILFLLLPAKESDWNDVRRAVKVQKGGRDTHGTMWIDVYVPHRYRLNVELVARSWRERYRAETDTDTKAKWHRFLYSRFWRY